MKYNIKKCNGYNIHTIKINSYKTTQIEFVFRINLNKEDILYLNMLINVLGMSTYKYKNIKKLTIACEEIYDPKYAIFSNKMGLCHQLVLEIDFINPSIIKDNNYIKNIINFASDILLRPNIKNNMFDKKIFDNAKNDTILDIESIYEDEVKYSINKALYIMDKNSFTSEDIDNKKNIIKNITNKDLFKFYEYIIKNSCIDIFMIGNTNFNPIIKEIEQSFIVNNTFNGNINYNVENTLKKDIKVYSENTLFSHSDLVMIYNLDNLSKYEKDIVFYLFNYIFGNGGLSSKLYQTIREKNGLCYSINSLYFKYDNLLVINESLSKKGIDKSIDLINNALKEMQDGNFSNNNLSDAKKFIINTLEMTKNNKDSILSRYELEYMLASYDYDTKLKLIKNVSKEDVVNISKKIKLNTIYSLSEDNNEKD